MMEMIQYSLKAEIAVTYELDPSIWKTSFIAGEFQDVLLNLVINSRDAILEQGSIVVKQRMPTLMHRLPSGQKPFRQMTISSCQ